MSPLEKALAQRPGPLDLFFRDDDAGWDMDALDQMLGVFSRHGCPVDLAVIPNALDRASAARLNAWRAANPQIRFHQHGYAHENHEPPSVRKCEFGPARSTEQHCGDIAAGRDRMRAYLGASDPIFTPPWNRCASTTAARLRVLGFRMVSSDGPLAGAEPELIQLPVSLDWDRAWRESRLEPALAHALGVAVGPVGIMLHHATLDAASLDVLDGFIARVRRSERISVSSMRQWLEG